MDAKYKNPRNLCSGSVRQLNNEITKKRNVHFFAFTLVRADGVDFKNSRMAQMEWLKGLGFDVVEYVLVDENNMKRPWRTFRKRLSTMIFRRMVLILTYDDIALQSDTWNDRRNFREMPLLLNGLTRCARQRLWMLSGVLQEQDLLIR